ncbi:DUF2624 family protein [Calidifontibacillus oryziterrae]|uniref:DUF2624 family protein n=1 Tax=Calidifontibacillus oryziterrae TaxID=1191699 RepID=UPI000316D5EE|nr:DUF2624 family protein [Calidifontibacillus oryziterrae]
MNPFIQQMINQKINTITVNELIKHGRTYNIILTPNDASKIIKILKTEPYIDIQDDEQHKRLIKKIGKDVSLDVAKKANELLNQFKKMM